MGMHNSEMEEVLLYTAWVKYQRYKWDEEFKHGNSKAAI